MSAHEHNADELVARLASGTSKISGHFTLDDVTQPEAYTNAAGEQIGPFWNREIVGVHFENTQFKKGSLFGSIFHNCTFRWVWFSRCDLRGVVFKNCSMQFVSFDNCRIEGLYMDDCNTKEIRWDEIPTKESDLTTITAADQAVLAAFRQRRAVFDAYQVSGGTPLLTCPACAYPTIFTRHSWDTCQVCGWEDDGQDDKDADDVWGGPNGIVSLTQVRLFIGRELQRLAEAQHGSINLDPANVMAILEQRWKDIEHDNSKRDSNIIPPFYLGHPSYKPFSAVELATLSRLIIPGIPK